MFKIVTFLILFLAASSINAQETIKNEYAILKNGDTIFGKVKRRTHWYNTSKINFIVKQENGEKLFLTPKNTTLIRSLNGVDGDCIIKPVYENCFSKREINGRIEVFMDLSTSIFYLSKNNSRLEYVEIGGFFTRKEAHEQVRPYLADNLEILYEYDQLVGSAKNIFYIIEKYNNYYK
ncbi:MAG: hypothetical protein ABGW76_09325 [Mesonia sp.]|uniref:hypothetical protein n=1 Tax=Mesonia sp. TaxID=1960830 RepID=UPI0032426734